MKNILIKVVMLFITLYRKIRAIVSTAYLKWRRIKCGRHSGAARFPHIGSNTRIGIGDYCSFNGITITGWGG
jgi:hypothetical protein